MEVELNGLEFSVSSKDFLGKEGLKATLFSVLEVGLRGVTIPINESINLVVISLVNDVCLSDNRVIEIIRILGNEVDGRLVGERTVRISDGPVISIRVVIPRGSLSSGSQNR